MQKWEYCIITGVHADFTGDHPGCYRLTSKGRELVTDFSNPPKGYAKTYLVAQFIAQLGEEGWEMVGAGTTNEGYAHILYFKRPKS